MIFKKYKYDVSLFLVVDSFNRYSAQLQKNQILKTHCYTLLSNFNWLET